MQAAAPVDVRVGGKLGSGMKLTVDAVSVTDAVDPDPAHGVSATTDVPCGASVSTIALRSAVPDREMSTLDCWAAKLRRDRDRSASET